MSLRVLQPGVLSLLVDAGRPGTRHLGVPLGGAADLAAFMLGNALAGNQPHAVALELTLSGPTLCAEHDLSACVFGAPFQLTIDGREISPGALFRLRAGETLKIGATGRGVRAYLCVPGGFKLKPVLGSGTALAPLAESDSLDCDSSIGEGRSLAHCAATDLLEEAALTDVLRVIDGPQANWFEPAQLFERTYSVMRESNRMGIRLQGEPLVRPARELVSEAVAPGAVQIANDGLPIILGVDGQTIGGYPKAAHVIGADLDRVGQLRPGNAAQFTRVTLKEAEDLARERRRKLCTWLMRLRIAAL
jgi:biotin-dependent carboxylase-like uncharacterized protein